MPRPSSFFIQSPINTLDCNAKVTKLIDQETIRWKEELISSMFLKVEANIKCNLPFSVSRSLDKKIWGHTKNGLFSVKSVY